MTPEQAFKIEFEQCETIGQMFDCINKHYAIEKAKPSPFLKVIINNYLSTAISTVKAELRTKK